MAGYKSWWSNYKSTSGWEKSHFGGFSRVISDYPYIQLDYELDVKPGAEAAKELGSWQSENLIKLYILKANEIKLIDRFPSKIIQKPSFFGTTMKKYMIVSLNDEEILDIICEKNPEIAPMFEHYKISILSSTIEMEIPEPKPGSGIPKGKSGKTAQELMKGIKESKPWSPSKSLSDYKEKPKFVPFDMKVKAKQNSYRFTESEKKDADMLVKLLDISFDPKSDEVKNLKLGKLDTSKIAEVPAGNISVYKQTVEEQNTKPFSVCILADMSGSMGNGNRIPAQHHILNTLYLAMSQILPPDKLFIYGHSGSAYPIIYTFYSPHDTEYEKNIKFYNMVSFAENYDGPVIEAIHKKIRETNDDRIIFISLSDGEPGGYGYGGKAHNEELKRILERARRDEFVTIGIGIEADHVGKLYTYSKCVWNLGLLPKEVSSIVNQVVRTEFQ